MEIKESIVNRRDVPCGRSAREVNKIVETFDELAALLQPNAEKPVCVEMISQTMKHFIVENSRLRNEVFERLSKEFNPSEENNQCKGDKGDKGDPIFPAPVDEPAVSSTEGSRKFYGRWREHWKVGARVELKKDNSATISATVWLPGRITRAIDTQREDPVDRYDVKLDNDDEVLEVNAADLRTLQESGPGAKKKDEPSEEGKAFATIFMFLLCVAFVKNYVLGV